MANVTDEDFAEAAGGFWIDPEGKPIRVRNKADHWGTMRARGMHLGQAYDKGYIRVSFFDVRDGKGGTQVTMTDAATVPALKELAGILRHKEYPEGPVQIENDSRSYGSSERVTEFYGEGGSHPRYRAASWAMRQAMIKNVADGPMPALEAA